MRKKKQIFHWNFFSIIQTLKRAILMLVLLTSHFVYSFFRQIITLPIVLHRNRWILKKSTVKTPICVAPHWLQLRAGSQPHSAKETKFYFLLWHSSASKSIKPTVIQEYKIYNQRAKQKPDIPKMDWSYLSLNKDYFFL